MLLECFGDNEEFFTSTKTPIKDGQLNRECSNSLILKDMKVVKVGMHVKWDKMESKNNFQTKNYI